MSPKVSIIIPVYNTEKYLRECLDSVLSQSLTDIEVICVNDGSTDSSLDILNEYAAKDPRVTVINSETNNGLACARDLGLQRMTGKWVKFVDSDDLLSEGTLERQVNAAEADDVDILVHTIEPFFESEEIAENFKSYKTRYPIHGEYPSIMSGSDYFQQAYDNGDYRAETPMRLFRAEFLAKNDLRFKKKLFSSEDEFFTPLATLYADRVRVLNEAGYLYRIRADSIMTAPKSIKYLRSRFIVCGALREELAKIPAERMCSAAGDYAARLENSLTKETANLRAQGIAPETAYDRYMFNVIEGINPYHDKDIQAILKSPSYKIGRAATAPLRKIRDLLKKS